MIKKMNWKKGILLLLTLSFVLVLSGGLQAEGTATFPEIKKANETYMQVFYWEMNKGRFAREYPLEENLWQLLSDRSAELAELGVTGLWLPPANKAEDGNDEGYAAYDLWDLGEFDQKGSIRTKYGTKIGLQWAIKELHNQGIKVFYDAVFNHRMGGDSVEEVSLATGGRIKAQTRFELKGRQKYYSKADEWQWDWQAFDGVDKDAAVGRSIGPQLFEGKEWDDTADKDFLMGNDVDYQNELVCEEMKEWGKWIISEIGFDGFRLDAIKHIDSHFINDWINYVQENTAKGIIFIGEAWYENNLGLMLYLKGMNNDHLKLFDFALRNKFALMRDGSLNMASLSKAGLVNSEGYGDKMVTFVDNHDTGREVVEYSSPIFKRKLQAYTYILTRAEGTPMVFWKDYYISGMQEELGKIMKARKYFAYGPGHEMEEDAGNDQNDQNIYSYVREGLQDTPGTGLVMMIAGGETGEVVTKRINSYQPNQIYYDFTGNIEGIVVTDSQGYGNFKVINNESKGWSIWVPLIIEG